MSHQYKAVAAIIKNSIASINEILGAPEDELHRISVTNDLQRTHDKLLLLTGTGDLEGQQSAILGPAKTIGGKPIAKLRKFTEADMIPSDDKVFQLKQEVEAAIFYFDPESNAEGILANIPDLIIRGVAKKAGMRVTKDEPKELTVEFIEQVKAAVALLPKEHVDLDADININDEAPAEPQLPAMAAVPAEEDEVKAPADTVIPSPDEQKLQSDLKPDTKKKAGK
jgi:hypothetical protein